MAKTSDLVDTLEQKVDEIRTIVENLRKRMARLEEVLEFFFFFLCRNEEMI